MKKEKLIAVRQANGYSITELADLLKIQNYSYQRRENGQTKMSHNEWEKIALFLKVPFQSIFEPNCSIKTAETPKIAEKKTNKTAIEIPTVVLDNQQEYIAILKKDVEKYQGKCIIMKAEIKELKADNSAKDLTIKDLNQKISNWKNNFQKIEPLNSSQQIISMAM